MTNKSELNRENAWKKVSDILAAKTKIFQLRVDSLYNRTMRTLQKKNSRFAEKLKQKNNQIEIQENGEEIDYFEQGKDLN
jgi:hypothetical protein